MTYLRSTSRAVLGALLMFSLVPASAGAITRDAVISRGKVWVTKHTPYSQARYAYESGMVIPTSVASPASVGYRTDCSGFVSMCLNLRTSTGAPRSLDSASLSSVLKAITKADLRSGDVILRPKGRNVAYGHALIFSAWTDATKTAYWSYEESGSNKGAVTRKVVPYPFFGETGFAPYRYVGIEDTFSDCELAVYGASRWEDAVGAANLQVAATGSATASVTVIVGADSFTDALSGVALAGAYRAPMLLSASAVLPNATRSALLRYKPKRVLVVGDTRSVSAAVQAQIAALGGARVTRISAATATETAAAVARVAVAEARARGKVVDTAYITTSLTGPDALAATPIASAGARPILFAGVHSLPASTLAALRDLHIKKVVILGPPASISINVQLALVARGFSTTRIGSSNVYTAAVAVARSGQAAVPALGFRNLGIVSGTPLAQSVCAGVAQGQMGSLLVLTPSASLDPRVATEIAARKGVIGIMRVYGGFSSIAQGVRASIATLLKAAS